MKSTLNAYRVMATVVGVLLVVLCLVGVPLANFDGTPMWGIFEQTPRIWLEGGTAHNAGEAITTYLGIAHGWLYMIFVFVAFTLSRRMDWELPFTMTTLICGTVPILSFWAERRATRRAKAQIAAAEAGALPVVP